ncbi:hypothetical protein ACI8B_60030 [Acinetobacter proteolyticus]|uniref:Uncharacterized protein n=1 Tax=Acinetobacter proteolyticus TaxID=1776741 RepID=A0A653KCF9_9GAMM|nr:hypothetical protein ACI8B_60030 [Acinetobacter proteolyticus]
MCVWQCCLKLIVNSQSPRKIAKPLKSINSNKAHTKLKAMIFPLKNNATLASFLMGSSFFNPMIEKMMPIKLQITEMIHASKKNK